MQPSANDDSQPAAPRWWRRLHGALMPDYNRKAATYWWTAVAVGAVVLVHALGRIAALPAGAQLQVAAGVAIAVIAGLFPIRIPRSKNSFAAGEIFIFMLLLMHGPAAAALAAAGEALVGSWRTSRRWTSRIVSPAISAIAMFGTGSLMMAAIDALQGRGIDKAALMLPGTMVCAVLYFAANAVLVAAVPYLKRSQWPVLRELFSNFGWVGLTFAVSGSIAALMVQSVEQSGIGVLVAAVSIIAMLLMTLHGLFRQQETDEAVRQSRLAVAEREAELAARHVRELAVSERRFHRAFSHASIGMALVSFDGRVLQVNPALCRLLGVEREDELIDRPIGEVIAADHRSLLNDRLMQLNAQQAASFEVELRLQHSGNGDAWAVVHGSFFTEVGDATPSLILQLQDVTARRQAEAGLQHIAFHDALTGLPNRRRFQQQLAQALQRVQADGRHHFALMFLDFDRFKVINDSLGHAVGDEFLVTVSRRIQQQVRPHDIVARLGGDEFAVLAEDLDSGRGAVVLAERLLEALRHPIHLAGTELTSSASIGITFSSMGYAEAADMLRDADTAMYKAKSAGKGRYTLFDALLHTEVARRMQVEGELRRAIGAGQLTVAYQPIVQLSTGRITGFEALSRWTHPELGVVSPDVFVPVAEDAGLMIPLTDFVLRRACRQLSEWRRRGDAFADLGMHVNLSGHDIAHPALAARVQATLFEARLPAQALTLELTENILMERLEAALPVLDELRRSGVKLSVDDFGTGYSSLQHLSTLPVTSLKIDRAFVAGLQSGARDSAIVRAVLLLGDLLGKDVIAEGIETPSQMDQLVQLGCGSGQGYLLSRPLTPEQAERLLDGLAATPPHAALPGDQRANVQLH